MQNTKNILKYLIFGGLFLVPFIAFIVPTGMFFPFISGKGFAFRILVEILFGLFVILAFTDKDYRPRFSLLTKSVLLFTLIILIADLLGQNVYKSIWSNYERMEGFVLLFHLALYYLVMSSVLKTKELWNKFFNTSIFASILMSIYGLFQLAGLATISQGGVRLDGRFGNSTYLAIYLVFHIFLCIYMLVSGVVKKDWHRWVYGLIIVLETVLLYFTATRGAILGLIGGLVLTGILIIWREKENKKLRRASYWIMGLLAVVILGFILARNTSFVKNSQVLSRFSTLSAKEFKTQGRYYVWPMAVQGIKDRPLLGWGQENFNFVFNKNYNPDMYGQEEWFDRTHNLFLDWLIAGGIIGFLAYISIYFALFYYIWRKESTLKLVEKSVVTGMISAYIFHNIFVFDNLISYIIFFSILAHIHSISISVKEEISGFYKKTFSHEQLNHIVIPLVVIATVGMIYFVNVPAIKANRVLIQAIQPQKEGVEKNLALFKQVFEYNSLGSTEALEQLVQTTVQIYQTNAPDKIKKDFYDLSRLKIEEKLKKTPTDARYLVFAGSFFNRFGQYDEAIKYLERALIESPQKQSIYFELGTAYLGKGDKQKMFELFKIAYELKPSSQESQAIYAVGAIYTKNIKVLTELAPVLTKERVISDPRFLKAYSDIGDYNSVIEILNARLEIDPANLQNKYTLAETYAQLGQKQKAISLLNEMIIQEPKFKEQGEAIIKKIQAQ
jgi:O-antigen ligase/tetratricopeptide (TPR) repeat protein